MFTKEVYQEASVSFSLQQKKLKVKIEYLPWGNAKIKLHTEVQAVIPLNTFLMSPC